MTRTRPSLAAFATAAARRYSGNFGGLPRVYYWQGLNEANLSLFFRPQFVNGKAVSADLFRALLNSFYATVKAVDPSNIVIAGGLGPIAVSKFTPLWATELSYDTSPPDPGGLPMVIASRWTAEALHRAWRARVTDLFWFSLRDFDQDELPSHESLESGLFFRGPTVAADQPKEVFYAFRFPFVAYARKRGRPALDFWGRTPSSKGGWVTLQALRGGRWRRVGDFRQPPFGRPVG